MLPPTDQFIDWLNQRQFPWFVEPGYLEMFPSTHSELRVAGKLWGYLWTQERIKSNAEKYHSFPYIGIGSLASGDWLAIDSRIREQPMIGSIGVYSLLEAERSKNGFSAKDFNPFDLSLCRWLEMILEDPARSDIPG